MLFSVVELAREKSLLCITYVSGLTFLKSIATTSIGQVYLFYLRPGKGAALVAPSRIMECGHPIERRAAKFVLGTISARAPRSIDRAHRIVRHSAKDPTVRELTGRLTG